MSKCAKYGGFVSLFAASFLLLILWNVNKPDQYLKILKSDFNERDDLFDGKLFNLDFKYLEKSVPCRNDTTYLGVIIVTSYFGNVEARSAMRRSFPSDQLEAFGLKRAFLLGLAPDDVYTTQAAVHDEAKRFGDLIQGNFKEAYRNLTYKHMMGLRWASESCGKAKYVIKMDDDVVFDVRGVVKLLEGLKFPSEMYVAGYVLRGMKAIRDPANKWFTTALEYGPSRYPSFVSGWFYVTTPKLCSAMVAMSKKVPYFWIDDVYVTGIVARRLKARYLNLNRHFAVHAELMQCCVRDLPQTRCDFLVGPNGGDNNMFYEFNWKTVKCLLSGCAGRKKPLNETCVAEKRVNLGRGSAVIAPYKLT